MNFEFATAGRILFGCGKVAAVPSIAREFGSRALLVTGATPARADLLAKSLADAGIEVLRFAVNGEPTVDDARRGQDLARDATLVIGMGGGGAIDAAKAIAALATAGGDVLDYLEVIGRAQPLGHRPLPFIAIPTTAGTGSEVTRNAVLGSPEHGVKASLRSPLMLADVAVIDPELTFGLPPAITASTGLDALTQLIEPYVSSRANAMTDVWCVEGMRRAASSLETACNDGRHRAARESMSFAALLGGLALANAGLGVVHGFAAPIGGMYPAPHGAVCAALLPHGMAANISALQKREPQHPALSRYTTVARVLTGDAHAEAKDGTAWVAALCARLKIPRLRDWGVKAADLASIAQKAAAASSMKANPVMLTQGELTAVLERAL
jgi:alcohol dehydrogenase class IV